MTKAKFISPKEYAIKCGVAQSAIYAIRQTQLSGAMRKKKGRYRINPNHPAAIDYYNKKVVENETSTGQNSENRVNGKTATKHKRKPIVDDKKDESDNPGSDEKPKNILKRPHASKKLRFEIFERDGFKCVYCGKGPPDVTLEVDHVKPTAKGGRHEKDNYITACFDCNRGKSDVLLDDAKADYPENSELLKFKNRSDNLKAERTQLENLTLRQIVASHKTIQGFNAYVKALKDIADYQNKSLMARQRRGDLVERKGLGSALIGLVDQAFNRLVGEMPVSVTPELIALAQTNSDTVQGDIVKLIQTHISKILKDAKNQIKNKLEKVKSEV